MHCLQQLDDFNGFLQWRRGINGPLREWHFLPCEERFGLWGLPEERCPQPGQEFPAARQALEYLDTMREALEANFEAIPEDEWLSATHGWPEQHYA